MNLRRIVSVAFSLILVPLGAAAQTAVSSIAASSPTAVPPLVPYSGVAVGGEGKPLSGEVAATFLIFKEETGGEPLFIESQRVVVDSAGHYKVQLGATLTNGISAELFASGEARWLEVQIAGEKPQPRVLLASVPYALKAADAATLGGLPASAFVLAGTRGLGSAVSPGAFGASTNVTTTGGVAGYLPEFSGVSSIVDSPLFVSGANVGIGTATPAATLDVNGSGLFTGGLAVNGVSTLNGFLLLPALGTATTSTSYNSQYFKLVTSAYNSSTKAIVAPRFQLQAEVAGNNTANPTGTLNLIASNGPGSPVETGFYLNSNGTIHFAPGQTFPGGAGTGTITGVTAGTALTGGGTSGNVTLNVDTTKVPLLASNNNFTGTMTVQGEGSFGAAGTAAVGLAGTGSYVGASGVSGSTASNAAGVFAYETATSGTVYGVNAGTNSAGDQSAAVDGVEFATSGVVYGVKGIAQSATDHASGVLGLETASSGIVIGVDGVVSSSTLGATGVSGFENSATGSVFGIFGQSASDAGVGVVGNETSTSTGFAPVGVEGVVASKSGIAGEFVNVSGGGLILKGLGNGGATVFSVDTAGNLNVSGKLTKGSGSFKIDDPLDPADKYLSHSFVESPDMMDVYNGNVKTDARGRATVELPKYFEALNQDFRYQLTVVGQFAQAIVATEIGHNRFVIRTNRPSVKVSWQVTGIRKDAYANANRIPVEEEKPAGERGYYLHPEAFGEPASKGIVAGGRAADPSKTLAALSTAGKP